MGCSGREPPVTGEKADLSGVQFRPPIEVASPRPPANRTNDFKLQREEAEFMRDRIRQKLGLRDKRKGPNI